MKNPCYDIHVSSTYDLCYDPGVLSERMTFYIIKVNYLNKDNIILKGIVHNFFIFGQISYFE